MEPAPCPLISSLVNLLAVVYPRGRLAVPTVVAAQYHAVGQQQCPTTQRELLDQQQWATRDDLASEIFEQIEGFYNPVRRHTSIGGLASAAFKALSNRGCAAA